MASVSRSASFGAIRTTGRRSRCWTPIALTVAHENVEVHIFPGVLHGYMMRGSPKAFHPVTRDFSMARALAILDGLKGGRASQSLRHAS